MEGEWCDKTAGGPGHNHADVVTGFHETADDLGRFVGGDSSAYAAMDAPLKGCAHGEKIT